MIVHTQSKVVGFTFNFKNGTIRSFIEALYYTNESTTDLKTSELIG